MSDSHALDKKDKVLNILTVPEEVFVFRYAPTTPIPAKLWEGDEFCSVTKTKNELSIVAPQKRVVDSGMPKASAEHCGGPWNVLRVRGPLEHRESFLGRPGWQRWEVADPRHGRRHGRARAGAQGGVYFHLHD